MAGPAQVLIVRHGPTTWSEAGRHTGRTDVALTDAGRIAAAELGALLRQVLAGAIPIVLTSPLQRSRDTAALALPGRPASVDGRLAELDYGAYEGLTSAEIRATVPGWELFTHRAPGGETVEQAADRCDSLVADLAELAPGVAVVLFTHGHLGRILTARLLGWPASAASRLYNDTASVGALVERRDLLVLDGWNLRVSRPA